MYGATERLLRLAMTAEVMVGCVRKADIRLFMSSPSAFCEVWSDNLNTIANLVADVSIMIDSISAANTRRKLIVSVVYDVERHISKHLRCFFFEDIPGG